MGKNPYLDHHQLLCICKYTISVLFTSLSPLSHDVLFLFLTLIHSAMKIGHLYWCRDEVTLVIKNFFSFFIVRVVSPKSYWIKRRKSYQGCYYCFLHKKCRFFDKTITKSRLEDDFKYFRNYLKMFFLGDANRPLGVLKYSLFCLYSTPVCRNINDLQMLSLSVVTAWVGLNYNE